MADASNVRSSVEQRRSTAEQWFAYLGRGYIAEYARRADRTTDRTAVVLCAAHTGSSSLTGQSPVPGLVRRA